MKNKIDRETTQNSDKPENKHFNTILPKIVVVLLIVFIILGALISLFFIGWNVKSDDVIITYSNGQDNGDKCINIDFKLKSGNSLKINTDHSTLHTQKIILKECLVNPFDNVGDDFQYGFNYTYENDKKVNYTDDDYIIIPFKDKTIKLYLKDLVEKYGE